MYYATGEEMEKLDQLAVDNGLEIRQMMELAGWQMVNLFERLKIGRDVPVVVVCGKGNKGGDGLSAARHLVNYGWSVEVVMIDRDISADAQHHLELLTKMELPVYWYQEQTKWSAGAIDTGGVLIDALIGYHLEGNPRGLFAQVIELVNKTGKCVVVYDLPSGLDPTSGECLAPCIDAFATLSLALPKKAFQTKSGQRVSGRIWLGDIGIPAWLHDQVVSGSRPDFGGKSGGLIELGEG